MKKAHLDYFITNSTDLLDAVMVLSNWSVQQNPSSMEQALHYRTHSVQQFKYV